MIKAKPASEREYERAFPVPAESPVVPARLGGPQAPTGVLTVVPLVLPDETVIRLREYAASRNLTVGEVLQEAMETLLNRSQP